MDRGELLVDDRRLAALHRLLPVAGANRAAMDRLAGLAATVLDAPVGLVNLIDGRRQHMVGIAGVDEAPAGSRVLPDGAGFCPAFDAQAPLFVDDTRNPAGNGSPDLSLVTELGFGAYAGCPLWDAGGRLLGTVCVTDVRPRQWRDADRRALESLAESVVSELMLQLERERQHLLAALAEAVEREPSAQGRGEVLVRTLVEQGVVDIVRLIDVDGGADGARLSVVRAVAARTAEQQRPLAGMDAGWPLADRVLAAGSPVLVDVDEDYVLASSPDPHQLALRRELDMRTVVLVPLVARGRVVGLLSTARTGTSPGFDDEDLVLLAEIGRRAAVALDNAMLYERLDVLQRATAALSAAATPAQVAGVAVAEFGRLLGTRAVAVWELQDQLLAALTLGGWSPTAQRDRATMPLDAAAPASEAARTGRAVWLERLTDWERDYPQLLDLIRGSGYPRSSAYRCRSVAAASASSSSDSPASAC